MKTYWCRHGFVKGSCLAPCCEYFGDGSTPLPPEPEMIPPIAAPRQVREQQRGRDWSGVRIGELRVLHELPDRRLHGARVYLLQCQCGELREHSIGTMGRWESEGKTDVYCRSAKHTAQRARERAREQVRRRRMQRLGAGVAGVVLAACGARAVAPCEPSSPDYEQCIYGERK